MSRKNNTNFNGYGWTESEKKAVWNKTCGTKTPGLDACGNLVKYEEHGNTSSVYGWEIDHIKPVAEGGKDDLSNLQVLQWKVNREKGDTYPWKCS